jgi:small conductance mechanosensitive channel
LEGLYEKLIEWGALYGTRIIGALAILIIGRIVVAVLTSIVERLIRKSKAEETLIKFVIRLVKIALLTFVFIAALNTLGVETASLIAVIGAAGLAVGFALQGSLSNFASGVLLVIFRPIKVNDLVELGGHLGIVKEIHIFNTILVSLDNIRLIIPNSKITGDTIKNYTAEGIRRIDLVFGIHYADDILKAKKVFEDILAENQLVLNDPEPTVGVMELGDSSVNFAVRPWVNVDDYWEVYFSVTEQVKLKLDANNITIPFPQRDIHLFHENMEKNG